MTATPPPPTGSRPDRDLRSIVADGVFFSTMVGLGETYVPAFALAAGLGDVVAGLVATLPMLAGALFQLVTPWAVRHLRSYRRWVVLCAGLQALSFVPLVVGAALGRISLFWLAVATVSYWAFGMATGPAWNAWITTLVPVEIRATFFASRTRNAHAALFAAVMTGGLLLQWGRQREAETALFAVLFAAALTSRLVSARFLAAQSEDPGLAQRHRSLPLREIPATIRRNGSGRVLTYLLGMQAAVHVAAPYFTPYMLGPLALSYAEFMILTSAAFLARVAVLPWLGRVAHRHGARTILWWGAIGIVALPVLWLVSSHFVYLLCVQIAAGSAWAALELATTLSFFEGIDEQDRASVLSVYNVANAAAIALGAALGSQIFLQLDGGPGVYPWLFVISSAGRLLVLFLLPGIRPGGRLLGVQLRTLAVRPSVGAVERPILASAEDSAGIDLPHATESRTERP